MKRKICIFLAFVFLLPVLVACGNAKTPTPTEPVGSSSQSDTATEKPTEKATRKPKETKPLIGVQIFCKTGSQMARAGLSGSETKGWYSF